ncbi:putative two-component system sensor protein [Segniliparus rotundus DSM 44985]|uniref:Putative two-component system sensor protein n=1 Tax=Segniliparus rotundus (strain ATCC BAA-972 / CDC 1076 / CIP 108378 / DSM 44985 / JCM 13578) TaxID=640132 RepID=D6ZFC3_SEGRD|nr:hypothetical protein [Segniliparus rotundus]ADG97647.1 putative two-component system sensor protein [Segniliparus rotundus DSM 44985]
MTHEPSMIDPEDLERFMREIWANSRESGPTNAEWRAAHLAFGHWALQHAAWELWKRGRISLAWTGTEFAYNLPLEPEQEQAA